MRQELKQNIPKILNEAIKHYTFLVSIKTTFNKFYYTNSHSTLKKQGKNYLPAAFQINKINFNDDGQDILELFWYHNQSLEQWINNDLNNTEIELYLCNQNDSEPYYIAKFFYHSSIQTAQGMRLYFKSIANRLEKNLVSSFSKTCRASLGDAKCGLKTINLAEKVNITAINRDFIITNSQRPSGYYNYGKLSFIDSEISILILQQEKDHFFLERNISQDFILNKQAILLPGCDKTLSTCTTKFANSINFRGEPFIPSFYLEKG